jgi:hypothetical protein
MRDSKLHLRKVVACYERAGVPSGFVRELLALELYRMDPALGHQFDRIRVGFGR